MFSLIKKKDLLNMFSVDLIFLFKFFNVTRADEKEICIYMQKSIFNFFRNQPRSALIMLILYVVRTINFCKLFCKY